MAFPATPEYFVLSAWRCGASDQLRFDGLSRDKRIVPVAAQDFFLSPSGQPRKVRIAKGKGSCDAPIFREREAIQR